MSMKPDFAKKFSYVGAGLGLVLFALFGLLYGSFLGGIIGLNIIHIFSGPAGTSDIIARITAALGMISGVVVACTVLVVSCTAIGWAVGHVIDAIMRAREKSSQKQAFLR